MFMAAILKMTFRPEREHGDEVDKIGDGIPFTRGNRKVSETENHKKSAITDHVVKENHVMKLGQH